MIAEKPNCGYADFMSANRCDDGAVWPARE